MLLNFINFLKAQTSSTRFVIHLEKFNLLKSLGLLPRNLFLFLQGFRLGGLSKHVGCFRIRTVFIAVVRLWSVSWQKRHQQTTLLIFRAARLIIKVTIFLLVKNSLVCAFSLLTVGILVEIFSFPLTKLRWLY